MRIFWFADTWMILREDWQIFLFFLKNSQVGSFFSEGGVISVVSDSCFVKLFFIGFTCHPCGAYCQA
jgi:hypothetical protein